MAQPKPRLAIYQRPDSDFSKRCSAGLAGLHCRVRIVDATGNDLPAGDTGEILLNGPNIMTGYWDDGSGAPRWLVLQRDMGHRDADGYYYITDRKKNMIISGGENIYPAEVERVLYEHPGVQDVAVVGMADEHWGEIPVAVVITKAGVPLTGEELDAFVTGQLARFKMPRQYQFVDELPRNAMGKIQHFKVRALFTLPEDGSGLKSSA